MLGRKVRRKQGRRDSGTKRPAAAGRLRDVATEEDWGVWVVGRGEGGWGAKAESKKQKRRGIPTGSLSI